MSWAYKYDSYDESGKDVGRARYLVEDDALKYGVNEAMVINYFRMRTETIFDDLIGVDGLPWVKASANKINESLPFIPVATITRIMNKLVSIGIFTRENFGDYQDRTYSYVFNNIPLFAIKMFRVKRLKDNKYELSRQLNPRDKKSKSNYSVERLTCLKMINRINQNDYSSISIKYNIKILGSSAKKEEQDFLEREENFSRKEKEKNNVVPDDDSLKIKLRQMRGLTEQPEEEPINRLKKSTKGEDEAKDKGIIKVLTLIQTRLDIMGSKSKNIAIIPHYRSKAKDLLLEHGLDVSINLINYTFDNWDKLATKFKLDGLPHIGLIRGFANSIIPMMEKGITSHAGPWRQGDSNISQVPEKFDAEEYLTNQKKIEDKNKAKAKKLGIKVRRF